MTEALQQGDVDGLCGIYSLLNFLVREQVWPWWEHEKHTFRLLMEACQHHGWLTPVTLTEGLEQHQLKKVLDRLIEDYRLPFRTEYVEDIRQVMRAKTVNEVLTRIVERGGSALVHSNRRGHWMMVTGLDNDIIILDSSVREKPRLLVEVDRTFCPVSGFGIIPFKRPLPETFL